MTCTTRLHYLVPQTADIFQPNNFGMTNQNPIVVSLLVVLVILIVLLVFLYKKLNTEADGEYTIHRIVYKEGGLRDQLRNAAITVGTHLGTELWPRDREEEDKSQRVEEGQVEDGSSQGEDDTDGEDGEEESSENEGGSSGGKEWDKSSLAGSEPREGDSLLDKQEEKKEKEEETKVEKQESQVHSEGVTSGGTGLLIDLNQFSGSAIWSGGEDQSDLTEL